MKKNKYLKNFNKYKKNSEDKKVKKHTFYAICDSYKDDLIVNKDYHQSKTNINDERKILNINLRDLESNMTIINGLMIPMAILIYSGLLVYDSTEFGIKYFCIIMTIGLFMFTFFESIIMNKINTYKICLDCLNSLEKELDKREEQRRIEEEKANIESQRKNIDYNKVMDIGVPIVSAFLGSGVIGKLFKRK